MRPIELLRLMLEGRAEVGTESRFTVEADPVRRLQVGEMAAPTSQASSRHENSSASRSSECRPALAYKGGGGRGQSASARPQWTVQAVLQCLLLPPPLPPPTISYLHIGRHHDDMPLSGDARILLYAPPLPLKHDLGLAFIAARSKMRAYCFAPAVPGH